MSAYPETRLSKIQLPSGFMEVDHRNPFYLVYLDWSVSKSYFREKLLVRSHHDSELLIITYGNHRRAIVHPRSEEHIESCQSPDSSEAPNLMDAAIKHLLQAEHLQDGHDAFIFAPRDIKSGILQEFSKGLVTPLGHPGHGRYWYLLGVIEKS